MSTVHVVPCSTDSCSDTMSVVVQTANKENTPYMSQAVAYSRLKKKKIKPEDFECEILVFG